MSEIGIPTPKQARANINAAKTARVRLAADLLRTAVARAMNAGKQSVIVATALRPEQYDSAYGIGQGIMLSSQRGYEPPDTYSDVAIDAAKVLVNEIRLQGWSDVTVDGGVISWAYPPEEERP